MAKRFLLFVGVAAAVSLIALLAVILRPQHTTLVNELPQGQQLNQYNGVIADLESQEDLEN